MAKQPTREQVLAQLERIVASEEFRSSPGIRKFIKYIVEKTLDGEQARLKGFAIGVDVFDRGDQFDPQADTIVRVQARNLRRALRLYNLTSGKDDAINIEMRKGSYVPFFTLRETDEPVVEEQIQNQSPNGKKQPQPNQNTNSHWLRSGLILTGFGLLILLVLFFIRNPA